MRGDAARRRVAREAVRTAGAVLVLGVVLIPSPALASAEPASSRDAARTVDEIAAALKEDPVLVQQVLGNGDAAGAEERISDAIADADVPVYVALVTKPGGLSASAASKDLAIRLHSRVGDGIFIVGMPSEVLALEAWGAPDALGLSGARYDALEKAHPMVDSDKGLADVAEAQIVATIAAGGDPWGIDDSALREIASAPWAVRPDSLPRDYDAATPGGRAVIATVAGLGVLLVGLRALLWTTARRDPAKAKTPPLTVSDLDLADLVARANSETTRLAEALANARSSSYADTATGYLGAAEAVLRGLDPLVEPRAPRAYGRQLRDAVGALVLARSGLYELDRDGRKNDRGRYVTCFFNPLHGRADTSLEVPGRGAVVVPACRQCAHAAKHGKLPDALVFAYPSRRPKPYYEEKSVWARSGYGALDGELWATVTAESAGAGR
ncbi:hypothetical protein H4N58_15705 [Mumia sp. ZJ1417]|uniref:hypothetical protein n=1 Tax=Mumia sp. ZJ1417 TaxID=2708082 RepID=UPI001421E3C6|nr:hypothetical protein [Mumia sp. ZJ1417]QMW65609.1 hypothetical protein H4N58_15705 [Mumia sp. ZJ1417]